MCEVLERSERISHIIGEAVSRCSERRSGSGVFHYIGLGVYAVADKYTTFFGYAQNFVKQPKFWFKHLTRNSVKTCVMRSFFILYYF